MTTTNIHELLDDAPAATGNVSGLCTELRSVIDAREKLAAEDKALSKRKADLERQLLDYHDSSGLDHIRGGGLTIAFAEDVRASVDPERWEGVQKWAVESGHGHILYRQLSNAKVAELIENGVPLPEGLTVTPYTKINVRRVK